MTLGVDVSQWQNASTFPWATIRASSMHFAYIRASVRSQADPLYLLHRRQARAAGLLTGSYHFLYPQPAPALQARAFAAIYLDQDPVDELPPMLDVEARGLTPNHVRAFLDAFAEATRSECGIYTSRHKWHTLMGDHAWWAVPRPLWVADWGEGRTTPRLPDVWTQYTFWQFTNRAYLPGYHRPVDLNHYPGTYRQFLDRYQPQASRTSKVSPATPRRENKP